MSLSGKQIRQLRSMANTLKPLLIIGKGGVTDGVAVQAGEALDACRSVLADESIAWEAAALETACRAAGDKLEMKVKNLLQPLRVAGCGNMVSPPLFESVELMKREDVLARIDATRALVYGA